MLMLSKMHQLMVSDGQYVPNAVDFDGTNDYLNRGAGLTGISDSQYGAFHCWFKISDSTDERTLLGSVGSGVRIRTEIGGGLFIFLGMLSGSLSFLSTNTYADGIWHSLLCNWDTLFAAGSKIIKVYIDDVLQSGTVGDASSASLVDLTTTDWWVGRDAASNVNRMKGGLAQLWFAAQSVDFTSQATRRKFITAENKPVNLGANGELPTGTQPNIFLANPAATFATNLGTGGNFTLTGTLTDTTPPG